MENFFAFMVALFIVLPLAYMSHTMKKARHKALGPAQLPPVLKNKGGPKLIDDLEFENEEAEIRFETNQRIERLRNDREGFFEFDANGDGIVDSEEIEVLRAEIEAQVRAELAGSTDEVDPPGVSVERSEVEAVSDPVPEQEMAQNVASHVLEDVDDDEEEDLW